jgi:hypothetical protein
MNEVLNKSADVILDNKVRIAIGIAPRNRMHALLQKYKILPSEKIMQMAPLYLGTLIKISKEIIGIEDTLFGNNNGLLNENYQAINKHSYTIAKIIAIAFENRKEGPSEKLIGFIINNFTTKELLSVFAVVLRQADLTSFMTTIISIKGVNILKEKSPESQGS